MKKFLKNILGFTKKYLTIIIVAFIFLFLFICNNTSFKFGSDLLNNLKTIATSFTPTTDLFDDGSEVSFVSYFFGMSSKTIYQDEIEYFYPTNSQNLSTNSQTLLFNYNGLVNSVGSGNVSSIGYNENNEKFVEIILNNGEKLIYSGLETVGVSIGDCVVGNKPIGIASVNKYLTVSIFNGENLKNLGEINWAN